MAGAYSLTILSGSLSILSPANLAVNLTLASIADPSLLQPDADCTSAGLVAY